MEGLGNRTSGKYISINSMGKFAQRVPKGTEGAITRINKENKEVSELYFDFFTGTLKNIKVTDSPYGKSWEFVFDAAGETYTLQLSYSNSYAKNILKMIQNVDLSVPFTLTPKAEMVEGKNKTSIFINQFDKPVKHSYTKDAPNGLPAMKQIKVKGQSVWDDTDALVFLEAMVAEKILPKLKGGTDKASSLDDIKSEKELAEDSEEAAF